MNRPHMIAAMLLCSALGWWGDSLIATGEEGVTKPAGAVHAPASRIPGRTVKSPPQPGIPVVDELLKLVIRDDKEATRAGLAKALGGLSVQDFETIARRLLDLRGGTVENEWGITKVAVSVASHWSEFDPSAAMDFWLSWQDSLAEEEIAVFMGGIKRVFSSNLAEATRLMAQVRHRETYIYARYNWIFGLKGMEPEKALAMIVDFDLHTRNDSHRADAFGEFPTRWVSADARAALTWALELPPSQSRNTVLLRMCSAWGESDAVAAQEFVEAVNPSVLPNGGLKSQMLSDIARSKPAAPVKQ